MTTPAADGMPTTRGLNFYLADPNLEFVCSTVMEAGHLARARPHLAALGEVAGGELDALAAVADRHPPVLRAYDETGVFTARDCAWLPALVDWTPVAADALAGDPAGGC